MRKGDIIDGVISRVQFPNKGQMTVEEETGRIAVTVKNTLPGQKVRVRIGKKRNGRADAALLEILERSPDELPENEIPCPMHDVCGGCTYLSLPYDRELSIKQIQVMELLQNALDSVGRTDGEPVSEESVSDQEKEATKDAAKDATKDEGKAEPWRNVMTWYEGIYSSPRIFGFRNKMEFTFGDEYKDGPLTIGMHRKGSFYDLADASECAIVDADYRRIIRCTRDFFREKKILYFHRQRHTGYLRHLLVRKASHTGEILIDLITSAQMDAEKEKELLKEYTEALLSMEYEGKIAGVLHTRNDSVADTVVDEGTEILYGKDSFEETLLGLRFVVTPFSFFQTNSYSAEVLYEIAREWIRKIVYSGSPLKQNGKGSEELAELPVIYDLYCGTGTISQLVSPVASQVIGVEIVEEAVEAARENAKRNRVDNCTFLAGDVLKVLDEIEQKPDLIILDPPRDGIHPKALPKITAYGVEYILYISCKPTSLARDLPYFIAAGYRPVRGASVDQFVWSGNVESCVLLERVSR